MCQEVAEGEGLNVLSPNRAIAYTGTLGTLCDKQNLVMRYCSHGARACAAAAAAAECAPAA